ncbi:MAG: hypothetical protein EP343_19335 [Deltaproteobacteria bacterium]|nr:MAG: hypothetical protein EP343_19335 [Deltaproteobacteria bacterium]
MIRRISLYVLLFVLALSPTLLMGAVCSRAIDIPILVTANLPNKDSRGPFVLNLDAALRDAGIQPVNGRIPKNVQEPVIVKHRDKFDLRGEEQIKVLGNRVHSIYINDIQVEAQENTLNTPLPAIQVSVTNLPTSGTLPDTDDYTKVAEFTGVAALETGALQAPAWETESIGVVKDALKTFAIAVELKTVINLKADDPWPQGKAQFKLKFQFAFVIKPI